MPKQNKNPSKVKKKIIKKKPLKKPKVVKKQIIKKTSQAKQKSPQQHTEYKSHISNKKPEIKATPEEKRKLHITEAKIKKMLNVEHLEELFYILNLLNDKQISLFIQHYKNSEIEKSKDQKIDSIIKTAKSYNDLIESLKAELAAQLSEELEKLKSDISEINRRGVDTYIESVKVMSIPLKIRLFLAIGKREDFYRVKKMLAAIDDALKPKRAELKKIKEQKEEREKAFDEEIKKKRELMEKQAEPERPKKKLMIKMKEKKSVVKKRKKLGKGKI